ELAADFADQMPDLERRLGMVFVDGVGVGEERKSRDGGEGDEQRFELHEILLLSPSRARSSSAISSSSSRFLSVPRVSSSALLSGASSLVRSLRPTLVMRQKTWRRSVRQ